jgi:cellulose synthase/poly-beta-1,6-N-acetylglucosamine synthase-like glycosyltransferase
MLFLIWQVTYVMAAFGLAAYGLHRCGLMALWAWSRLQRRSPAFHVVRQWPRVTVQLPVYNEAQVVERLIDAAARLDYPRELLEIQVLDDSDDGSSARIAGLADTWSKRGITIVHRCRKKRIGYKAGALREGLAEASGELIAIFDADFVPPRHWLREVVPYLAADPTLAFVQTRWGHLNREASGLARLQALFLDGHFLIEQEARCAAGRFLNFNGSAGIWRAAAIHSAGNWQDDTLTEDLDLSYRAQLAGWRALYLPEIVVPAELPDGMPAFKSQQHRWAKGSVQTCLKLLPTIMRSRLPWKMKIEAFFHLTGYVPYLFLAAFALLSLPALILGWRPLPGAFWVFDVPLFLATYPPLMVYYGFTIAARSPDRGADILIAPGILALGVGMCLNNTLAMAEALAGWRSPFVRTPKSGSVGRRIDSSPPRANRRLGSKTPGLAWKAIVESALAAGALALAASATASGPWASVPFILVFFFGFAYVAALSFEARSVP